MTDHQQHLLTEAEKKRIAAIVATKPATTDDEVRFLRGIFRAAAAERTSKPA